MRVHGGLFLVFVFCVGCFCCCCCGVYDDEEEDIWCSSWCVGGEVFRLEERVAVMAG